jgi:hypothetical protein
MHDAWMLGESGLYNSMRQFAFSRQGEPMCIYGESAYPIRMHIQARFRQEGIAEEMQDYMNQVRVSVEWLFGNIVNYFKFLDFKKNLKIRLIFKNVCSWGSVKEFLNMSIQKHYIHVFRIKPTCSKLVFCMILYPMCTYNLFVSVAETMRAITS